MKKNLLLSLSLIIFSCYNTPAQVVQLWGTTTQGGTYNDGTIFKINPDGSGFQTMYNFQDPAGWFPYYDLLLTGDNQLYGVAEYGGAFASCTIFTHYLGNNVHTDLHDFYEPTGDEPGGGLVEGPNGILYGVSYYGGLYGVGVIYSWNTSNNLYTDLYDFDYSLGDTPIGTLLYDNGKLYGVTTYGGMYPNGIFYSYDITSTAFTKLFDFNTTDGTPTGGLIKANNGKFYGMGYDSFHSIQVLYSYDPGANAFQKLVGLNISSTGSFYSYPNSYLMQATNGKIYGVIADAAGNGVLFSYDISSNVIQVLHNFQQATGMNPMGNLVELNGKLYGTAMYGGVNNYGVVYSFDLSNNTYTDLFNFNWANGSYPLCGFLKVSGPVNLPQLDFNEQLAIYPNPMTNTLNITFGNNEPCEIIFYDLSSREVLRSAFVRSASVNTEQLAGGLYIYEVRIKDAVVRKGKIQKLVE